MAANATSHLEQLITSKFLRSERALVALQPQIETGIRCHQRAFKFSNGIGGMVDRDRPFAINLFELLYVAWNGLQHSNRQFMGRCHLARIGNRATCLRLEIGSTAIPELRDVVTGIQHRGRIDGALRPAVPYRRHQVVSAAPAEIVARIAADPTRQRKPRIKEQLLAELHFGCVQMLGTFDGLN